MLIFDWDDNKNLANIKKHGIDFNEASTVCHCYRESESVIRIISARKATKTEEKSYVKGI